MEGTTRAAKLESTGESIKPRVRPFTLRVLMQDCVMFAVSALLASYAPFEGVSPFGAACIMAAWYTGLNPYFACSGAILGVLLGKSPWMIPVFAAMGGTIFLLKKKDLRRVFRLLVSFAAEAILMLVTALAFRKSALLLVGSSTVSVFAAVVLASAIRQLRYMAGGRGLSDAGLLSMSASAGLITLAMRGFNVLGQSPAMIFAGLCVLFASYRLGLASCAFAVTVGAGRALASGSDLHFIAVLAASALLASSLRSIGKWVCLGVFGAVNILFTALVRGIGVFSYFELGVILLIFALVPARLYAPPSVSESTGRSSASGRRTSLLEYRAAELSDAMSYLSASLGGSSGYLMGCVSDSLKRAVSPAFSAGMRYSAEFGTAQSVKAGSAVSGDGAAARKVDGKLLIALSDGMGSGCSAFEESREVLELLQSLVTAGASLEEASEIVNESLCGAGDGDMYATLDAMLVDLSSGAASIVKRGAPPSFVLRRGRIFTLSSEELPVGIIGDARGKAHTVRLRPGDTVIMMTDGVSDALGNGLNAAMTENVLGYGDPEITARALLDEAKKRGRSDDMTVLIARIEERAR